MLVLHSGSVVRTDLLIDALWGDAPPQSADNALAGAGVEAPPHARIRLGHAPHRHAANGVRPTGRAPSRSTPTGSGSRQQEGRALLAAGDPAGASRELTEALSLWRGPTELELDLHRLGET